MKVAWLFSGLPRSPEYVSEEFLRLMGYYASTVVAHFWSCDEQGQIDCCKRVIPTLDNAKRRSNLVPDTYPNAIEEFKRIYSPSNVFIEPCSVSIAVSPYDKKKYIRAYLGQTSAQRALSLINPAEFDIIVKCRTDVLIYRKEVPRLDVVPLERDKLYTVGNFLNTYKYVNDTFLYGHPKVMVPIINSVDSFWQLEEAIARDVHKTLKYHSKRLGLSVVTVGGPRSGRKVRT